jgi:PilZ domain
LYLKIQEEAMQSEQRCDEKRISILKPVELLDPNVGIGVAGTTKNLSSSGLQARFDMAPSAGDVVQLQVALAENTAPLETLGKVVWCSADIYGDGAEVGLKFIDESEIDTNADHASDDAKNNSTSDFVKGRQVSIESDGRLFTGTIDEVDDFSEAEPGKVKLSLTVEIPAPAESPQITTREIAVNEAEILNDAEDWKPHPFRDIWNTAHKYGRPVLITILAIAAPLWRFLTKAFTKIWRRLPAKPRNKVEALYTRLKIPYRTMLLRSFAVTTFGAIMGHYENWRTMISARRPKRG